MGFLAPKPVTPVVAAPVAPTPVPPPPDRSDQQTTDLAASQRRQFYSTQSGRAMTELSQSNFGNLTPVASKLLGDIGR